MRRFLSQIERERLLEQPMPLFGRKPETKNHGTAGLKEEAGQEPERNRLLRQLEDERSQRLDDVHKRVKTLSRVFCTVA